MKNYEAIKLKNIIKVKEAAMVVQIAETDELRKENLILKAQLTQQYKEAYNKAIDDAIANVVTKSELHPRFGWCTVVDRGSIRNLKKK